MYAYEYDPTTGGILLKAGYSEGKISKEPRLVYAKELDMLGFNKYWKYSNQEEVPYMWAEANYYYYRGKKVASLKGGNLFEAPQIVIEKDENGESFGTEENRAILKKIDIARMIEKNRVLLQRLETTTVKKIKEVFEKYQKKADCVHVAFSGGKDSIVLLHLIKQTLPEKSYIVCFADTGMEFPDTYKLIESTEESCKRENIQFFTSRAKFTPEDS